MPLKEAECSEADSESEGTSDEDGSDLQGFVVDDEPLEETRFTRPTFQGRYRPRMSAVIDKWQKIGSKCDYHE